MSNLDYHFDCDIFYSINVDLHLSKFYVLRKICSRKKIYIMQDYFYINHFIHLEYYRRICLVDLKGPNVYFLSTHFFKKIRPSLSFIESRNLCEPGRVSALQEQTVAVFCERDARRVGRLLLLLPPARALCRVTLHELLFKPTVGDVSVERLLGDMVGALRPA